jgi:hypothetical protein
MCTRQHSVTATYVATAAGGFNVAKYVLGNFSGENAV